MGRHRATVCGSSPPLPATTIRDAPQGEAAIDTSTHVNPAAYLTEDLPPLGGRIKSVPEDFLVEEIPLYAPSGKGEHIYLFVEKRGVTAMEMVHAVARHFRVSARAIGYAGLKDRQAITRQVVSVHTPGRSLEDFPHFEHPDIRVLWADMHANKLKRGHLAGNRFSIKIRGVGLEHTPTALRVIRTLERFGVPDRIGPQRFGYLRNNHLVGLDLLRLDPRSAIDRLLGPSPEAPENQHEARALFAAGDFKRALAAFPHRFRTERQVLASIANGEHPEQAIDAIDADILGFYFSAFQSAVFNAVLDERVVSGTLGELLQGDLCLDSQGRRPMRIDEPALVDPTIRERFARLELNASGPMWGSSMLRASDGVGQTEEAQLRAFGLTPEMLANAEHYDATMVGGTRRPLRIPISNTEVEGGTDELGPYIRCAFDLPRGAFATTVLDEIMKPDRLGQTQRAAGEDDTGDEG